MPRPWERADAEFCYHFAADAVLRWQSLEYGPLYPRHEGGGDAERRAWFGDVPVPKDSEGTVYVGADDALVETLYVDTATKDRLLALAEHGEIEHRVEVRRGNTLIRDLRDLTERLQHVRIRASGLVSRPPVWQVVLAYEAVPLSRRPRVLPTGGAALVDERPAINEIDTEELRAVLGSAVATSNLDKIAAKRSALGAFARYQQVRDVSTLSDAEFAAIARTLRL